MPKITQDLLQKHWGYSEFLSPQEEIIQSILDKKDTLAILPTGGGKSLCFQLPILALDGICLVISPLVALMKDQVTQLKQKGIKAALLTSELTKDEVSVLFDNCQFGGIKLLYVSPERLKNFYFQEKIQQLNVQYIAVDEAHCISEWGHDFRPAYLEITEIRKLLPEIPILALTATATPFIEKEIIEKLDLKDFNVYKKSLKRENLHIKIVATEDKKKVLVQSLQRNPGSTIVFCKSRKETFEIAQFLKQNNYNAKYFHAKLQTQEKNEIQNEWVSSNSMILVSTLAFGMGIDKPDVRLVVHYHIPNTVEAYFQEIGRAGRDGIISNCILLKEKNDIRNNEKLYKSVYPNKEQFINIIKKLYNFYQIGEGENPGSQFGFSMQKFIETYDLPKKKTKFTLEFLDRQGLIQLHETQRQSLIKILISNYEITDEKDLKNQTLSYLARNFGGIFNDILPMDEFRMRRNLNISSEKMKKILAELNAEEKIYYRDAAIIKISFPEPRDERFFSNTLWKNLLQRQQIGWKRLQDIHFFVQNESSCRSKLLLNYFGEKQTQNCGTCDNCLKHKKVDKTLNPKELIEFLSQEPKELSQIIQHFLFSPTKEITQLLQLLMDEEKIKTVAPNQFTV